MAIETETKIVCDALALMRQNIEAQYNDAISSLPRHGKGVATARDEHDEHEVMRRITSIDALIETYTKDSTRLPAVDQPKKSLPTKSTVRDHVVTTTIHDYEPYINPFTGQWVIPEHPDKPGPSGTVNNDFSTPTPSPKPTVKIEDGINSSMLATPVAASRLNLDLRTGDLTAVSDATSRDANLAFEAVSCDALWEAFGEFPTSPEAQADSSAASTHRRISVGSNSPAPDTGLSPSTEVAGLTAADKQDIESCLQDFEDQLSFRGWHRQPEQHGTASQTEVAPAPTMAPRIELARVPTWEQQAQMESDRHMAVHMATEALLPRTGQAADVGDLPGFDDSQFELDRRKALELAEDIPQDFEQLFRAQQETWQNERQNLEAIQDDINRKEQADIEATLALIRKLQDDWNQEADQLLQQEQDMAQQIAEQEDVKDNATTLKEMRRIQEQLQAEDDRRFQEDLRLARQLAEVDDEQGFGSSWQLNQSAAWPEPPPYSETSAPGAWPDEAGSPALPQPRARSMNPFQRHNPPPPVTNRPLNLQPIIAPPNLRARRSDPVALGQPSSRRQNTQNRRTTLSRNIMSAAPVQSQPVAPGEPGLSAADRDNISASLDAARNQQRTWEDEIRKNEAAARAAQKEVHRLEQQAREESERLRREEEQRRLAELQKQEAERKARLAKEADCSVCSESLLKDQMCRLPCNHYYCRGCLLRSIQTAVKDRRAFQCCKQQVTVPTIAQWLPPQITAAYTALTEELATPNPTYCHLKNCSSFIPPALYSGDSARCPRCSAETCRLCKQSVHAGVICKQDAAGQALINLGNKKKWTQCPHCKTMVERRSGCLHMSCTCGMQFCYNCGRPSNQCGGENCKRR